MMRRRSVGVLVAMMAGCSSSARPPSAAPEPVAAPVVAPPSTAGLPDHTSLPAAQVTLADVGLEAGSLDRTADPCVDFYQFACGGWIQNNPVPSDRARWSRGSELNERNTLAIRTLLDDATRSAAPSLKKLGDFYASCLDEAAVERAGLTPWKPLLARLQNVGDARSWLAAVAELHKLGVSAVWSHQVFPDLKDSTHHATYLDAGGLSLPDRDYYLKPEFKAKLDGFTAHAARMLGRVLPAGATPAQLDALAADVVAIETELARLTKTAVEQRDIQAMYNPTDIAGLAKRARSVDWRAYWRMLDAAPSKQIILGTPRFFDGLDALRAKFRPAQWGAYFALHVADQLAVAMPRALDDEAFQLDRLVSGVEQRRERPKRCVDEAARALGDLLGEAYVARAFPPAAKQNAAQLVDALVAAMAEAFAALDWMSEPTRQRALAKLGQLVRRVGYPDRWRSYDFAVKRDDFAGNAMRAAAFERHRRLARAGKVVDRTEWEMDAFDADAYYNPLANNTALPAGILQPPFFHADRTVAANLGGIGMVIGHELTHGFDDQGAQFDADGNLANWWQPEDLARFGDKATCLADQYSQFEALPKLFVQGKLTLGENIADLGGVKLAFRAYRNLRKDAVKTYVADGFTEDQQFFVAVGQAWCSSWRPAEMERHVTTDVHAPHKFRIYGALRNLPAFAEAFRCAAGTPMRPAKTCEVW